MLTLATLIAAGISPTQARNFLDPLLQTCDRFDIDTPQRQAGFVAQCAHESNGFADLEEHLWYRDPARIMKIFPSRVKTTEQAETLVGNPEALANTVYAWKNGNGDAASGDGFRFRGRGLIQLTGRTNYSAAALDLSERYIDDPDLVSTPPHACLTAGWYWDRARCNDKADASDIDGITRSINGPGMAGADKRRLLYSRALGAFR